MADRDIQIGLRDCAFRLHDIPVTVIGFSNDWLRFGVGTGAVSYTHLAGYVPSKSLIAS